MLEQQLQENIRVYENQLIAPFFIISRKCKQPKWPSNDEWRNKLAIPVPWTITQQ